MSLFRAEGPEEKKLKDQRPTFETEVSYRGIIFTSMSFLGAMNNT